MTFPSEQVFSVEDMRLSCSYQAAAPVSVMTPARVRSFRNRQIAYIETEAQRRKPIHAIAAQA
jgi:hypothetical protein